MGIAQPFDTRAVTMVTTMTGMGSTVATTGSSTRIEYGCIRISETGSSCTAASARGGITTVAGVRPTTRAAIVTRTFGRERSVPFGTERFLFVRLFVKIVFVRKIVSKNLGETEEAARSFLSSIQSKEDAVVVGLYGDLGSGKTAFVQAVARVFKISGQVTSPTFVILKRYGISNAGFKNLYHIDCYRLKEEKDLESLGFKEIVKNPENIIFIEWVERVEELLPKDAIKIHFNFIDDRTREITFME